MQIKSKYSWMKHIDFMIIDSIALFISYLISYYLKFGNLDFAKNDEWTRYLFIVLVLSLVINFFTNPYSGILKRSYYMEIIRVFQLAVYNLLFATAIFIADKLRTTRTRSIHAQYGNNLYHMGTLII